MALELGWCGQLLLAHMAELDRWVAGGWLRVAGGARGSLAAGGSWRLEACGSCGLGWCGDNGGCVVAEDVFDEPKAV